MNIEVLVPQMGESVLEGTILEWKVKVGEKVSVNQSLVELMTDKVNVEIPSEFDGILTAQLVAEGEVVAVGAAVCTIDDGKAGVAPKPAKAEKTVAKAAPSQTAASTVAVASSGGGSTSVATPTSSVATTGAIGKGKLSPKVRMMIREYGIDASVISPTGKDGRVKVEDVLRAVEGRSTTSGFSTDTPPPPVLPMSAAPAAPVGQLTMEPAPPKVKVEIRVFEPMPANLRETRSPLAGARKMISDHMVNSEATSVHVTTFEEIDLTELAEWRNEIKGSFRATYGANITFLPFIMKAVCIALKEFPTMNASMTQDEIIVKNYYNIGVAVAREEGLIVPVIKNADRKSIVELAVEIAELGDKARTNRLMPDDVSDGTFTLTNAGMFGATGSTPIISQPQVAILGIHAIAKKPWVVNDEIVIRHISNFGMSFDHRLIDGHTAVQFLHRVHEYLADVRNILLYLR